MTLAHKIKGVALFLVLSLVSACSCDDKAPSDLAGAGDECNEERICNEDTHCVNGYCVPWQDGEYDDKCARPQTPEIVKPKVQCEWSAPAEGDPAPNNTKVLTGALVANLGIETIPGVAPRPSIIFVGTSAPADEDVQGALRVIDGATCADQAVAATFSGDPEIDEKLCSSATPAIGDINGDGRPDIVAAPAKGGMIAFTWDPTQKKLVKLWRSHTANGAVDTYGASAHRWGGISLSDLNDDGRPEIIYFGAVWSPDGVRLSAIPGWASTENAPVLANIDDDPAIELVSRETVWEWNTNTNAFVAERAASSAGDGQIAIADFGEFPNTKTPGAPEIVHIGAGNVVLYDIKGAIVRSFSNSDEIGGPPTIADFDGDGLPEIGAAFRYSFHVYDAIDNKELWTRPSDDSSSGQTGSSVFDFNGDGKAEVVYADEVFIRVYDGTTGEVTFSQARASGTWNDFPVVADVDNDFAAEIVVVSSRDCANGGFDPLFRGLRCEADRDCASKQCVEGFCRCSDNAGCTPGFECTAALANTPGTGKVCRDRHVGCKAGIRVLKDARDNWAAARPLWNQHAYHITNINDDLTVPRSSLLQANWKVAGYNNFRQNVPGNISERPAADLTARAEEIMCGSRELRATVCNRGAALADADVPVAFYVQQGKQEVCKIATNEPIAPGACISVLCTLEMDPQYSNFSVVVDPDDDFVECESANNGINEVNTCGMAAF